MSNFLSQNDPAWKLKRINGTTSTLGSYGCLITCVTWLLNKSGVEITPDQLATKSELFDGSYWNGWKTVGGLYPALKYAWGVSCINEPAPLDKIVRELDDGFFPIIMLDYAPKVTGLQTHYLVVMAHDGKGNLQVGDPIDGAVVWLDSRYGTLDEKYKVLKVDVLHHTKLQENDADLWERIKSYLTQENNFTEGNVREGMEMFKNKANIEKEFSSLRETIISRDATIADKNNAISDLNNQVQGKDTQISYETEFRIRLSKDLQARSTSHGDILSALTEAIGNESKLDSCMRENQRIMEKMSDAVKTEVDKQVFDLKVQNARLQGEVDKLTKDNLYLQKRIDNYQSPNTSWIVSIINKIFKR